MSHFDRDPPRILFECIYCPYRPGWSLFDNITIHLESTHGAEGLIESVLNAPELAEWTKQ